MGWRDRLKSRLAEIERDAEMRNASEAAEREGALRAALVDGEELLGIYQCRPYDSLGEWVCLTSQRIMVAGRDGQAKRSIPYRSSVR